ncbi:uncharacterized protein LOC127707732 [Mytilus californianus]|uniref:uncharacterized protein LOC127707732 n=1 Tax=Mytilus californianus TaxID=6549 RepID=UPI0022451F29|nr:uncharacterized protein LOC127707732 [Mytilus californianus]XP_052068405.1 uncharacterized protein LOC127707732 [Mytilus californianus]
MDKILVSEMFPNENQGTVPRSKRKHSDSVDDNENIKKQKVDLQNEQAKDNIKVENEEKLLQSENNVSPENKEENIRPTHSELNESKIAHLKDDYAFNLDQENELKSNLTITRIENGEESKDLENHPVSQKDENQFEQSEISCEKEKTQDIDINTVSETVSESDTIRQNSDVSSTGIDTLYSRTSGVPDPEPIKRKEAKKFRKLYRLMREGENKDNGLMAKNPRSNTTVAEHVANGSNEGDSRYISTCSTLSAAQNLLRLKTKSKYRNGNKKIVEIDVNNLPLDVDIIDLTEENLRKSHEARNDDDIKRKFHRFAASHGEVLLVGYIPADCLKYT